MWILRKIVETYLPEWWRNRIDLEKRGIKELIKNASEHIPEHSIVLDAGAGQTPYREWFKHTRYVAVDFAEGEKAWDYNSLDAIGQLERLPFPDHTFDAVISTQVLEHVPEPEKMLREIFRVLKPGASLYLSAPLGFGEHQQPYDYYRYTQYGLKYLLEKVGFLIHDIKPRGGYFWYMAVISMWLYTYLFPSDRKLIWKILFCPFQLTGAIWFVFLNPLIMSSLDFLDTEKSITLGYSVIAKKS